MASCNLNSSVTSEINELAAYFAELYCGNSETIQPHIIAQKLDLSYSTNNYGLAFEGWIEHKSGKFHVFINTRKDEHLYSPRVRFSFAHELGHYIIDDHRNALMQPGVAPHGSITLMSDLRIEREADLFAACLLMPENRIRQDVFRQKFSFTLIDMISKKYQVSITATLLRFIALGNHPIMVVCSRAGKVIWRRFNEDFPFYTLLTGTNNRVPLNSSVGDFFNHGTKYDHTETVFAEDWFILRNSSDRGRQFFEHCIYSERLNQVVSVIWER